METSHMLIMLGMTVIMGGICAMWIIFIVIAKISQKHMPEIDTKEYPISDPPMVSIIVPAKNEEECIGQCVRTLIEQDYENYEIILVDDDSSDATYDIIKSFEKKHDNITSIYTKKPAGWLGKTWACTEAAKKASGKILLFTDADTEHKPDALRRAVSYMEAENLDCLTLTQKLGIPEMWIRATIPVIMSFKLVYPDGIVYFSSKSINDPKHKMGGAYGAFILIQKNVYADVGGFESVKNEILEDWAIGRSIKKAGHKLRLANGSKYVSAMWARDLPTLNDIFKRLILQFVRNNKKKAIGACIILLAVLFAPYPLTIISGTLFILYPDLSSLALFATSGISAILHMASYRLHAKALGISRRSVFLAPVGGFVASVGFLDGIRAKGTTWRGRKIMPDDVKIKQKTKA